MKRFLFLIVVTSGLIFAVQPAARAQEALNHVEIGVFGDYFRLGSTQGPSLAGSGATAFGGVGARLSINASRRWQIEAESNYDFAESFTEGFTSPTGTVGFNTSSLRILHGMAGPKFQSGGGFIGHIFRPPLVGSRLALSGAIQKLTFTAAWSA